MKSYLCTLLFLLAFLSGFSQWEWQWPLPHGNTMFSVEFVDELNGYAVGSGGTIQHTTDGGQTWEFQSSGTSDALSKVEFIDSDNGWIVSQNGKILRTVNGGETWIINQFCNDVLSCVDFIDQQTGWICGSDGLIANTTDGGASFQIQSSGVQTDFHCIRFYDNLTGFCSGDGDSALLKTSDGGLTWTPLSAGFQDDVIGVDFINRDTIIAVGESNLILMSYDGGSTWSTNEYYTGTGFLGVTSFENRIYIPTGYGRIFRSEDYGENWVLDTIPVHSWLFDVDVLENGSYYVSGMSGIIAYRADDSSPWQVLQGVSEVQLGKVAVSDPENVWVVGGDNIIRHSMDGGVTWSNDSLPDNRWINNIIFTDPEHGFITASGNTGNIFRTLNGGQSWENIYTGAWGAQIEDIQFLNDTVGWMASQAKIFKTTDGGITWQQLIDTIYMTSIFFTDENHGWVTAGNKIGLTTDGGQTWTFNYIAEWNLNLIDVFFLNDQLGWCGGYSGQFASRSLFRTIDGGITWERLANSMQTSFFELYFIDEFNGYSIGQGIFHTSDGGLNWEKQIGVIPELYSLAFFDETTAWACGHSAILHTTNGGINTTKNISCSSESFYSEVYPNPSNGSITFAFDLPEESTVEIAILSSDGRLVDQFSTPTYPSGTHTFNWTAGDLPTGFYICHLKAGRKFSTQKLIIDGYSR